MVLNMNRASLDLATVLPDRERHGDIADQGCSLLDLALLDLETRAVRDLVQDEAQQRRIDMEAAIGLWAGRTDLVDTEAYLRDLREDDRRKRSLSA
jgi:hypothetical protein